MTELAKNPDWFYLSDAEAYSKVLDLIHLHQFVNNPTQLALLKLGLSLHSKAPAVQAHYEYYQNDVVQRPLEDLRSVMHSIQTAQLWVQWKDKQACNVDDLKKAL